MMRKPRRVSHAPQQRDSVGTAIPAPVKGWNARDAVADMDPLYAIDLINWFPGTATVNIRPGSVAWVPGFPAAVECLMSYSAGTTAKLFACAGAGIYDASLQGALPGISQAIANPRMLYINFATAAGNYLICVNGTDPMYRYDGTTWTAVTSAITGFDTHLASYIALHKQRIWMVKKDSMSLFYLDPLLFAGAAHEFPVGAFFKRGGAVLAVESWTFDGGDGVDDYLIIASTNGEILVYKGTDPSSATTFAIVGLFRVGEPIGTKCLTRFGGDLLYLSSDGLGPLSKILLTASVDRAQQLTDTVKNAFLTYANLYKTTFGWSAVIHPAQGAIIVNIPLVLDSQSVQFVMNIITGAWCQFQGWNANAVEVHQGDFYYADSTTVYKGWVGVSDNGANIVAYCQQSYNYFGSPGAQKKCPMLRPTFSSSSPVNLSLGLSVDFQNDTSYSTVAAIGSGAGVWDTGVWDTAVWGGDGSITRNWASVPAWPGTAFSLRLRIATNNSTVAWTSTDFLFEKGGIL